MFQIAFHNITSTRNTIIKKKKKKQPAYITILTSFSIALLTSIVDDKIKPRLSLLDLDNDVDQVTTSPSLIDSHSFKKHPSFLSKTKYKFPL